MLQIYVSDQLKCDHLYKYEKLVNLMPNPLKKLMNIKSKNIQA